MNPLNPHVPSGAFALIQVEVRTGIVLAINGQRYCGSGERFIICDSLEAAKRQSDTIVKLNPEVECIIQDENNCQVATIRDEEHVQRIIKQARDFHGKKGKLWKFW